MAASSCVRLPFNPLRFFSVSSSNRIVVCFWRGAVWLVVSAIAVSVGVGVSATGFSGGRLAAMVLLGTLLCVFAGGGDAFRELVRRCPCGFVFGGSVTAA